MSTSSTYNPIQWQNGTGQPINAENLNRIEAGISNSHAKLTELGNKVSTNETGINELRTSVSGHSTTLAQLTESVATIDPLLTTTAATVGQHSTSIEELKTNDTVLSGHIATLDTGKASKTEVEALRGRVESHENATNTSFETVNESIASMKTDIESLQNQEAVKWEDIESVPEEFTPIKHDDESSKYGAATEVKYGHVKLYSGPLTPFKDAYHDTQAAFNNNDLAIGMHDHDYRYALNTLATDSAAGLLSSALFAKLEKIEDNANYVKISSLDNDGNEVTTGGNALSVTTGKALLAAVTDLSEKVGITTVTFPTFYKDTMRENKLAVAISGVNYLLPSQEIEVGTLYAANDDASGTSVSLIFYNNIVTITTADSETRYLYKMTESAIPEITEVWGDTNTIKIYDANGDGVIDNSKKFDGHDVDYFAQALHAHEMDDIDGLADKFASVDAATDEVEKAVEDIRAELGNKAAAEHIHNDYADRAFEHIKVDGTEISANNPRAILSLKSGEGVSLSADVTNRTITVSADIPDVSCINTNTELKWNEEVQIASINSTPIVVKLPEEPKVENKEISITSNDVSLDWDTPVTIATVNGVDIKATLPANPHVAVDCKSSDATLSWDEPVAVAVIDGVEIKVSLPEIPVQETPEVEEPVVNNNELIDVDETAESPFDALTTKLVEFLNAEDTTHRLVADWTFGHKSIDEDTGDVNTVLATTTVTILRPDVVADVTNTLTITSTPFFHESTMLVATIKFNYNSEASAWEFTTIEFTDVFTKTVVEIANINTCNSNVRVD